MVGLGCMCGWRESEKVRERKGDIYWLCSMNKAVVIGITTF